jgi:ribonuclease HI
MDYTLYTDGGSRGNPGPAGAGAIAYDALGKVVAEVSEFLGERTNNYAEYEAVILGLEALAKEVHDAKNKEVLVRLDSELVAKQMKGEYRVKHPEIGKQFLRLQNTITRNFKHVSFEHIPREKNEEADGLANDAMDRGA